MLQISWWHHASSSRQIVFHLFLHRRSDVLMLDESVARLLEQGVRSGLFRRVPRRHFSTHLEWLDDHLSQWHSAGQAAVLDALTPRGCGGTTRAFTLESGQSHQRNPHLGQGTANV